MAALESSYFPSTINPQLVVGKKKAKSRKKSTKSKKNDQSERDLVELQQKLELLQWRKRHNENQIRALLVTTKNQQELDLEASGPLESRFEEQATWVQAVLEDELNRPLQVDNAFLQQVARTEESDRAFFKEKTGHNLERVKIIKQRAIELEEGRRRCRIYKEKRANFQEGRLTLQPSISVESPAEYEDYVDGLATLEKHIIETGKLNVVRPMAPKSKEIIRQNSKTRLALDRMFDHVKE